MSVLLKSAVGMLVVARLLVPTESAAQGETLWLVQLWLAAGLLWGWYCFRERDAQVRFDWCDVAIAMIVVGHVVSALHIVATEGQKRAALNMLWEWVGLGVAFFLIRQTVRTRADGRRLLLVMLLTAVCLSGLGVWQHYIFYPQAVRQYRQQRSELDRLMTAARSENASAAIARQRRIRELQSQFSRQQIPLEGPGRTLWEERLQSSTEPFGLFALANTFAGLLVVWLIVALAVLVGSRRWQRTSRMAVIGAVLAVGSITFCLLLTKSRTAWVGLVAGLAMWGWLWFRRGGSAAVREGEAPAEPISDPTRSQGASPSASTQKRSWLRWALLAVVMLGGLLAVAGLSGGIDFEVISEAPKSLRYRLGYWNGTWNVLRESPWLGTGPGNFRQHYLKHKLPESSEEIADPHNLVLGLWANGGLLAVVGLAALLAVAVRIFGRSGPGEPPTAPLADKAGKSGSFWNPLVVGAALSFGSVFLFGQLFGDGPDYRLLVLFLGWIVLAALLGKSLAAVDVSPDCLTAAGTALLVHLLAAGGIEMPAITQTLLLLLAVCSVLNQPSERVASTQIVQFPRAVFSMGAAMLVLFVACLLSATAPVLNRRSLVAAGDSSVERGNESRANSYYLKAAQRDPLSPEPTRRLAELAFRRWEQSPSSTGDDFQAGVKFATAAIEQDPIGPDGYRTLGLWYLERHQRTRNPQDAETAAQHLAEAVVRYPHHAVLRSELAEAYVQCGRQRQAREQVQWSLELDQINRREGHRDKYLPPETADRLRRLLEGGSGHGSGRNPN